ncbi:hypothetical protein ACSSS7_005237 [Eimeria intestinalis]
MPALFVLPAEPLIAQPAQHEQATTAVAAAPAATESAHYTSEETRYSLDTAHWHSSRDTLAKLGTPSLSEESLTSARENEAATGDGIASGRQQRRSAGGSWRRRSLNAALMAASIVVFFSVLTRLGTLQKLPSLPPPTQRPSGAQPQAQEQAKGALAVVQEYATSIDAQALQQLPETAKSIGLSLRYSVAAEEAASLMRHARAVEVERTKVLLLESHLAEGRISEAEVEKYAKEALGVLEEKIGALLGVARSMHLNAHAKASELVARADNALASLKAQHETVSQIKVAGGAPYLKLQQFLLSRWCLVAEQDAASMRAYMDRLSQLRLAPMDSLSEGAAELRKVDDVAKHMSFLSAQLLELTRDAHKTVKALTQVIHVRRCLEASAAVRSLRPDACRLRVKQAKAQAAAKRLSPEGAAEVENIGNVIGQIYEAFNSLDLLSASITRSKDPAAAAQDLEQILIMRQQIADGMQGLEARLDSLVQATEVTAAEEFNVADQVLLLHHNEALKYLAAIRFLAKLGSRWGKEVQAALSKEASGGNPFFLVSLHGKRAMEAAKKIAMARQEGEQLLEGFGGARSLLDAATMYSKLQQHLTQVEEWMLTLVEGVATLAVCEALHCSVVRSEASIQDVATALDAKSRGADKSPLLPASEDSVLRSTVLKFQRTDDLMEAGQLAVKLQGLARKLQATRLERDATELKTTAPHAQLDLRKLDMCHKKHPAFWYGKKDSPASLAYKSKTVVQDDVLQMYNLLIGARGPTATKLSYGSFTSAFASSHFCWRLGRKEVAPPRC